MDDFLERVIDHALFHVGRCTPVSNAYNATLVAGCSKILDPFVSDFNFAPNLFLSHHRDAVTLYLYDPQNGFWVSVGWCLILFIPTIVLCVKLSALYQKSDPYPGPLVEA